MHMIITCLFSIVVAISTSSADGECDPQVSCGCSTYIPDARSSRIVGGFTVPDRRWGWMISLQYFRSHRCGASLINAEYAITAAHCVEGITPRYLSILAGTNTLTDTSIILPQRRVLTEVHIHPGYDWYLLTNDIAIIRFSPLNTGPNSTLSFICLPQMYEDPFTVDTDLVAIGWGALKYRGSTISNTLQQVTVQVISSSSKDCVRAEIEDDNVQFCAGLPQGGKDTCQGDSGGPYMAFVNNTWILAGLTSNGIGCAWAGYPSVCTRVSSFISYIQSIINSSAITGMTTTTTTTTTTTRASTMRSTTKRTTTKRTTTVKKTSKLTVQSTTTTLATNGSNSTLFTV